VEHQAQTSSSSAAPSDAAAPVAGQAALLLPVPANLIEFMQLYGSDGACRKVLIEARWPDRFCCPRCRHTRGYELREYPVIECARCGHQASATAGTILHGTKLELHKLFLLLYLLVAEKDGANCKQLKRQVGVNYKTARPWPRPRVQTLLFRAGFGARRRHAALYRQAGLAPLGDASAIIVDVRVSQLLDRTGRLRRSVSGVARSVEHQHGGLVGGQAFACGGVGHGQAGAALDVQLLEAGEAAIVVKTLERVPGERLLQLFHFHGLDHG
jgi:hypothetical protein